MNTTDITRMTIASATSFGKIDCKRLCSGHAMAMMKRAQAMGATTVRATLTAVKIAMIAITATIVRIQ